MSSTVYWNVLLSFLDSEMYSASQYEFRSSPDIRRNFPFPNLRTEEAPTRWLLGMYSTKKLMTPVMLLDVKCFSIFNIELFLQVFVSTS